MTQHNEECKPRWYRWSGYFRGEHTSTKWHYADDPHDEKVLCGVKSRAFLAAWKDAPKRELCDRCRSKRDSLIGNHKC